MGGGNLPPLDHAIPRLSASFGQVSHSASRCDP
jgi:hypothetical protein